MKRNIIVVCLYSLNSFKSIWKIEIIENWKMEKVRLRKWLVGTNAVWLEQTIPESEVTNLHAYPLTTPKFINLNIRNSFQPHIHHRNNNFSLFLFADYFACNQPIELVCLLLKLILSNKLCWLTKYCINISNQWYIYIGI